MSATDEAAYDPGAGRGRALVLHPHEAGRYDASARLAEASGLARALDLVVVDAVERTTGGKVRPFVSRSGTWGERLPDAMVR